MMTGLAMWVRGGVDYKNNHRFFSGRFSQLTIISSRIGVCFPTLWNWTGPLTSSGWRNVAKVMLSDSKLQFKELVEKAVLHLKPSLARYTIKDASSNCPVILSHSLPTTRHGSEAMTGDGICMNGPSWDNLWEDVLVLNSQTVLVPVL